MKRKTRALGLKFRKSATRDNFTQEQLAAIGAVAMAYNDAEFELNSTLGRVMGLAPMHWNDVATRVNGAAGKKELISITAKSQHWPTAVTAAIEDTLMSFIEWKGYRDSIVHAKIADKANAIGHPIQRQGSQGEVLLTVPAVEGVYERLVCVYNELKCLGELFEQYNIDKYLNGLGKTDSHDQKQFLDQRAKRLEPKVQAYLAQVQEHQKARRSLKPLPKFPEPRVARIEFGGGQVMKMRYYDG